MHLHIIVGDVSPLPPPTKRSVSDAKVHLAIPVCLGSPIFLPVTRGLEHHLHRGPCIFIGECPLRGGTGRSLWGSS